MKPTEILSAEHRVIEQVLDCLDKLVHACGSARRLDKEAARDAVEFLRMFADRCHHGKEETLLFSAMEEHGFSRQNGPVAVMLHEHDQGRMHLRAMDEAIDGASGGDSAALKNFVKHGRAYVDLLRQHIQKEDHCLFPMAEEALSAGDEKKLLAAFEKMEEKDMGAGTHEKYLQLADGLAERLGVPRAAAPGAHGQRACGCGGH